jgi:hypothetical protein
MKPHTSLTGLLALFAVVFGALGAGVAAAQTNAAAQGNIGVAAATRNQVEGVVNSQTQSVAVGNNVFSNELIRTGEDSLAQLLFLDQTSLSVAPKSEVTLDRFVYNPSSNAGTVGLHATIGAFRFVTGSQNPRNYRIETPVATISVRGTILDLLVWSDYTIVIIQEGSATVTSLRTQLSYDLTVPGTALIVWASGRVEGPITWDSTLIHVNGQVPFPLYGNLVWPSPVPFNPYNQNDPQKSLNDILNLRSSNGFAAACPAGQIATSGGCIVNLFPSDVRLKRDIEPVKALDNGLTLYRYRYLWSDTAYVGVMAQDVAKTRPDAVVEGQDGYLRVAYDRLGLTMQTWRSWLRSRGVTAPE